jgi:diguanylate cyclase (GGDEF)-like protein
MDTKQLTAELGAVGAEQTLAPMRRIDRRESWLWASVILVTSLLAIGLGSFALPTLFSAVHSSYAFLLRQTVPALLGLVVLFTVYVINEQARINRKRREFANTLYQMAVLDPATGMFNRRYVMHRLEGEIARSNRYHTPLTVIAFDLDRFKQINDEYGHADGDNVLKTFGQQLKKATRGSDVAARLGGDEFLAVLPDCNIKQVQLVLQRMRGLRVKTATSDIEVLYSAGWTDYVPGESLASFLKRADDMLYANKRSRKELREAVTV